MTPTDDSDRLQFQYQPRSQAIEFQSHTPVVRDSHLVQLGMQHSGLSPAYDACMPLSRATRSIEQQFPTPEYGLGQTEHLSSRWPIQPTPRIVPDAVPLDLFSSSPMPYPNRFVTQSIEPELPEYSNQGLYTFGFSDEQPWPSKQPPSSHFSWSQPDCPLLNAVHMGAVSTDYDQISSNFAPIHLADNADRLLAEPASCMLGWKRRASAFGEQPIPRLSTDFLAPPDRERANRSPSSASTIGSSSSFGRLQPAPGDVECHPCNLAFANHGELSHHLRSHQPYSSRRYGCNKCDKRFQYRKDLHRHLPRHDPYRKRYHCPYPSCKYHKKGFGRQDHLDRHIGSQHHAERPISTGTPLTT